MSRLFRRGLSPSGFPSRKVLNRIGVEKHSQAGPQILSTAPGQHAMARPFRLRPRILYGGLLVFLAASMGPASATDWLTGADFHRQLRLVSGVAWHGDPLRDALENLSRQQRVVIFLDRQIDPDRRVDFSVRDVSLAELLEQLAEDLGLGICYLDAVVYIGPPEVASRLQILSLVRRDQITRLPQQMRQRWLNKEPLSWNRLAEPRQLIASLAAELPVEVANAERIPHDLWPAVSLPPLSWTNRMLLLLAGFELTFEFESINASAVRMRLVDMSQLQGITRTFPLSSAARQRLATVRERFPTARVRTSGRTVSITASLVQHEVIHGLMDAGGRREVKPTEGRQVHSLRVENQPVGALISVVARQLKLEVTYGPGAQSMLDERVTLDVNQVSTEELLRTMLQPAGLKFELEGANLTIGPE